MIIIIIKIIKYNTVRKVAKPNQRFVERDVSSLTYPLHTFIHSFIHCTKVVSSNSAQGEVYSIKFVSDLRQVGGFLWVIRFPPPIKLTATI